MSHLNLGGRGSGRTTHAMRAAKKGSVYVWVNHHLDYPKQLARKLGREDLVIVSPEWLRSAQWRGRQFPDIMLDHEARLDSPQWEAYTVVRMMTVRE